MSAPGDAASRVGISEPRAPSLDTAAPTRGRRRHATLALARIEASLLVRSPLTLGGWLAGFGVVWGLTERLRPLWWSGGWQLGYGQMVLSATVLVAAQLAAGRARRDGLQDLYASLPASAATRVRAQLLAILGAVPAALLLLGATAAVFAMRGVIGSPDPAVLAAGVLLVLAGAAIGIAVGARFSHPMAGILAALVWFGAFSQTNRFGGGVTWLFPWRALGPLGLLPAPLAGYPPGAAHAGELAAIAVLAGAVALAEITTGRLHRIRPVGVAAVALAAACVAGAVQLQPVPTAALDHLAVEIDHPAAVQQCSTTDGVRYCLYPGFDSLLPSLRGPVDAVLAELPARPAQPLTVRQVADTALTDSWLTYGHTGQQISRWLRQMQGAAINSPAPAAIHPIVGRWPAGGSVTDARFDVALATAEWAVGLPPTSGDTPRIGQQCVPVGQAREAIAVWLALRAMHRSASPLRMATANSPGQASFSPVGNGVVATWVPPGADEGYLVSGPALTADGYLLARAMIALPVEHVEQVLRHDWARWLNPGTKAADLAAALGVPAPTFPVPPMIAAHPPRGPGQPVCR